MKEWIYGKNTVRELLTGPRQVYEVMIQNQSKNDDIADVSGSIRLFSDVMKRLGTKLDGDELYEEFQRIYDESVDRDASKDKAEYRSCKKEQDSVHFI